MMQGRIQEVLESESEAIWMGVFWDSTVSKKLPNCIQTIPQHLGEFGPTLTKVNPEFGLL